MTSTLNRVQPSRRSGQVGTILLDGLVLLVLAVVVGLAWGFDLAFSREPDQSARPTLFAHMRRTVMDDVPAPDPLIAQNNPEPEKQAEQPKEPEAGKPEPTAAADAGEKVAAAQPKTTDQTAAAAPNSDNTAQLHRPSLDVVRPPPKAEHKVEFFEVKGHADTVAFVVDCSSSMTGSRFWRARYELMHAIMRLQPDQKFYVIFFSSGPVMLFRNATPRLEDAGLIEKARTLRMLPTVIALGNTFPEQSVQIAANLNPDIIYLLSDGEFDPLSARMIQQIQKQQTKVHTIAFESGEGRFTLEQIARDTGGTYRFVPPKNLAVDLYDEVIADFVFDTSAMLPTAQPADREKIRQALATVADQDFGPAPTASPTEVVAAVKRWRQWATESLAPIFRSYSEDELLEQIQIDLPRYQVAALKVAAERMINAPQVYIDALKRPDPDIVQAARQALLSISRFDFGPEPGADDAARARAIAGWERWLQVRDQAAIMTNWTADRLVRELGDSSSVHRHAAVLVISRRQLKLADAIFPLLHDPDADIRETVAVVLEQFVPRDGLGPKLPGGTYLMEAVIKLLDGDNAEERAAAEQMLRAVAKRPVSMAAVPTTAVSKDWDEWWNAEKEARAEQHLTLAKRLYDQKKMKPALLRFREIEKDYPGTKAAQQAHDLAEDAERSLGK